MILVNLQIMCKIDTDTQQRNELLKVRVYRPKYESGRVIHL